MQAPELKRVCGWLDESRLWSYCYVEALRFDSGRGFIKVYCVFGIFKKSFIYVGPFLHSLTW